MNFTKLNQEGRVEGFCLVRSVQKKLSARKTTYLDMTLADSDGEMVAKLWDYQPDEHDEIQAGKLVKVRGTIQLWQGKEQMRVEKIRLADSMDNVSIADFVPCTPHDGEWMFDEILAVTESWQDADLKAIVRHLLMQNKERLVQWPAAVSMHHAAVGGLLHHTLSMLRVAGTVCRVYTFLDRSLLEAGVMLHDIAKTLEIATDETGLATEYTAEGMLLGHLSMGALMIDRAAQALCTPHALTVLLQHMLISHHGEPEYGSAIRPMFPEAEMLSELDTMDARMFEMQEALKDVPAGVCSQRVWAMDNRRLYQHGRGNTQVYSEL